MEVWVWVIIGVVSSKNSPRSSRERGSLGRLVLEGGIENEERWRRKKTPLPSVPLCDIICPKHWIFLHRQETKRTETRLHSQFSSSATGGVDYVGGVFFGPLFFFYHARL